MKIRLDSIDYVLYVELDQESLLPKRIFQIKSEDIETTVHGRVSFRKAFKQGKAEKISEGDKARPLAWRKEIAKPIGEDDETQRCLNLVTNSEEVIMTGINTLTDAGITPPPPPPPPPPPAQEKVEARKRPRGLTILSILWSLGCVYNLYTGFNAIRIDLNALQILSNPSLPEWFRFGIPAELVISIIVAVFGIIQMFTIYGWWTRKPWSYKTALSLLSISPFIFISSALLYMSAPIEYDFTQYIYMSWSGFGASIIGFIIYYWYLRKPHVREYLGVGVNLK